MGLLTGRGPLLLALVAAIALLAGCGGGGSGGSAHVNEDSGSTNGVPLDEREGTPPPPPRGGELEKLADQAECLYFSRLEDEGNEEVPPGTPESYKASVPVSGPHVEPPHQQADGAYLLMPQPIDFVAALDHGRVEIQYSPGLEESAQLQLKGLFDTMYGGTLLFPNEEMRFTVAATAWNTMLGCTIWQGNKTIEAVRAFAAAKWGKGGNGSNDDFPVSGPTPKEAAGSSAS
jgi:hypothetical protein